MNTKSQCEEWRPPVGFEGYYEVSNQGRVRGLDRTVYHPTGSLKAWKGRILSLITLNTGYVQVQLVRNGESQNAQLVHRLVAQAFIPNPDNKPHVNHLNGIKSDNRADNLAWCTPSENEKHSYAVLGKKPNLTGLGRTGALHAQSKKVYQFSLEGMFEREHGGATEASRWLASQGLIRASQGRISCCARGEAAYAYGHIWLYDIRALPNHLVAITRLPQHIRKRDRNRF